MQLLKNLQEHLDALDAKSLLRKRRHVTSPAGPLVMVEGRDLLCFSSNDYLSLAGHPNVAAALREGVDLYGAGSGASHLISGHSRAHAQLEERLAAFVRPCPEASQALYFCTGYMANLAVLTALAAIDKDTEFIVESLNHASLVDGARLTRTAIKIAGHADLALVATLLQESTASNKIVVTDSVFSMDGDLAPLPELLELCERYGAWLVVDDAHGFGVLGENGCGAFQHFNLCSPYLVYVGTLGKAAGVGGAFVAAHATVIETLIQRARPYIFTTAAPPALAHALLTSLDMIAGEDGRARRAHLQALTARLKSRLRLKRWKLLPSDTAIQPIVIGDNEQTMRAANALYEQGYWVGGIRPPTVPAGTARLRITLAAGHTVQQVDGLAETINRLEELA